MYWRIHQRRVVRRHRGQKWARRYALRNGKDMTVALARADLHARESAVVLIEEDVGLSTAERARAHTWAQRMG